MKLVNQTFEHKGTRYEIRVAVPESVNEALKMASPETIIKSVAESLIRDAKFAAMGRKKRARRVTLDLNDPRVAALIPYLKEANLLQGLTKSPEPSSSSSESPQMSAHRPETESGGEYTPEEHQSSPPLPLAPAPQSDPEYSKSDQELHADPLPEPYRTSSAEAS